MIAVVIILAIAFIGLSVWEYTSKNITLSKRINQVIFATGILIIIASVIAASAAIGSCDAEQAWRDMEYSVFFSYVLFSMAVLTVFLILLISAVFLRLKRNRVGNFFRIIRCIFSPAASIFLLILSVYGYFIDDNVLNLSIFICLISIGESMTVRIVNYLSLKYDDQRSVK